MKPEFSNWDELHPKKLPPVTEDKLAAYELGLQDIEEHREELTNTPKHTNHHATKNNHPRRWV